MNQRLKKCLITVLCTVLFFALVGVGFQAYVAFAGKQVERNRTSIGGISDKTYAFTYLSRNDSVEIFSFDVTTERDVHIRTWRMNLLGSVSVSIAASDGTIMSHQVLDASNKTYQVHLAQGKYQVTTHFSNAFAGGCVVGVSYQQYYNLPILVDTDLDGLSDEMEEELGTDRELADTDGDSLSDYAEAIKYKTNPLMTDSDGDGTPDGDWDERREYAYSAYAQILIREPFDIEMMNDTYQDVRVIAGPDRNRYTEIEAIIYPDTQVPLAASTYPLVGLPADVAPYIEPGIATTFNAEMQTKAQAIVGDAETDIQATQRILDWIYTETSYHLDYSIPEFYFTYIEEGEVRVRNYDDPFPAEDLLRTHYFADSMFAERTHGTCSSVATLKCAMLRAAGIPCRIIQTLPVVFYHGSQTISYTNSLTRDWSTQLEQPPGDDQAMANHAYLEVYLGGRWLRVDRDIGIYFQSADELYLKTLSIADWSEVDFSETYPVDWIDERPFYTLLIEDQEPKH